MFKVNALMVALASTLVSFGSDARAQVPAAGCSVSIALRSKNSPFDQNSFRRIFNSVPKSVGICPWDNGVAVALGMRGDDCAKITVPHSIFRAESDIIPLSRQALAAKSAQCFPIVRTTEIKGVHDVYVVRPMHLYTQEYKFKHNDFRGTQLARSLQVARERTGVRYATLNFGSDWVCVETARGEISPLALLDVTSLPGARTQNVERKYANTSCKKVVARLFGAIYPPD